MRFESVSDILQSQIERTPFRVFGSDERRPFFTHEGEGRELMK